MPGEIAISRRLVLMVVRHTTVQHRHLPHRRMHMPVRICACVHVCMYTRMLL